MFVKVFWILNIVIPGTLLGWFSIYWIDLARGVESFGVVHALSFLFLSHSIAGLMGYRKYVTKGTDVQV